MCRSAQEFPPNGKRCGRQEHWTAEERQAHRDQQNAKRRERYHRNKKKKTGEEIPVTTQQSSPHAERYLELFQQHTAGLPEDDQDFGNSEDLQIIRNILQSESGSLHGKVISEDTAFNEHNESSNDVHKITLEDGSNAYFKPLRDKLDGDAYLYFGVSSSQEARNEVAAYKLSQALGGYFSTMVPETTLREYNGQLGTVQQEVQSANVFEVMDLDISEENKGHAAVFDFIAGSMDRHSANYINIGPPKESKLIDNGFAFPEDVFPSKGINASNFSDNVDSYIENENLMKSVQKLVDSPDGLGMKTYLSEKAYKGMMVRAKALLDKKTDIIEHFHRRTGDIVEESLNIDLKGGIDELFKEHDDFFEVS